MTKEIVRAWKNPVGLLLALTLSISALAANYHDDKQATNRLVKQQEATTAAFELRDERQRAGLCGFQVYLTVPISPTATDSQKQFRVNMENLTGPKSLNCTPDPYDGK